MRALVACLLAAPAAADTAENADGNHVWAPADGEYIFERKETE